MQNNMSFPYWSQPSKDLINQLSSQVEGLSQKEAKQRVETFGLNTLKVRKTSTILLFVNQFKNPIMLIMIVATLISIITGDWIDSLIILLIVFASVLLSFFQEYSANNAVNDLKLKLQLNCQVMRDGKEVAQQEKRPGGHDPIQMKSN